MNSSHPSGPRTTGDTTSPGGSPAADYRRQIGADLARTVLEAAARRLAEAVADYDAALDRHAPLHELQSLDRDVARAERAHADAVRSAAP